jgi:hypothetical protein
MDSRSLELAAEFCELVGKPNLLEYLGLPEDASPDAAQKKLKARRKYMQGMQSNPKYKAEAIFLIKHFSALSAVLETPLPYLKDARRRAESQHLPVLEMTVKGVLAGGTLSHDQEDYLRRSAAEIGVSEATFDELLERLARDAGVPRASAQLTISADEMKSTDFYLLLGVARHASRDEIYARYRQKKEECRDIPDPRQRDAARTKIEKGWKVLSEESSRRTYDMSWTRTGPPARAREVARPKQVATAPPVRPRDADPSQPPPTAVAQKLAPARMEVLSEPRQRVKLSATPVTVSIVVRNGGEQPLRGTIRSDRGWLQVITTALSPDVRQQSVQVQIDPTKLKGRSESGQVFLVSESGETASVEYEVSRDAPPYALMFAAGAGVGLLVLAAVGVWVMLTRETTHVIDIDPWAEEVLIDGKAVGHGTRVVLASPRSGMSTLTVRHLNFKPWVKDVDLSAGQRTDVKLDLAAAMDFEPSEGLKRANLDQTLADDVMSTFKPRLDACLRAGTTSATRGYVRIHVGKDGHATGLEVQSDARTTPAVLGCLRRQAAGPVFPPLADGDFATVRYDYVLPAQ